MCVFVSVCVRTHSCVSMHMHAHTMYIQKPKDIRKMSTTLELGMQVIVHWHVDAGK